MGPGLEQKTCMKKTCMKKEKRLEQKTFVKKAGTMAIGPQEPGCYDQLQTLKATQFDSI